VNSQLNNDFCSVLFMFQIYAVVRGTNDVCGGICIKFDGFGGDTVVGIAKRIVKGA